MSRDFVVVPPAVLSFPCLMDGRELPALPARDRQGVQLRPGWLAQTQGNPFSAGTHQPFGCCFGSRKGPFPLSLSWEEGRAPLYGAGASVLGIATAHRDLATGAASPG